jgi:hypothetical protein
MLDAQIASKCWEKMNSSRKQKLHLQSTDCIQTFLYTWCCIKSSYNTFWWAGIQKFNWGGRMPGKQECFHYLWVHTIQRIYFYAEDCVLFFSLVPDEKYAFEDENAHEVSTSKYKITVLIHMRKCEWVWKDAIAGYWKVRKAKMLQARISYALFMEFLNCLERRMAAKRLKVLLSSYQCAQHRFHSGFLGVPKSIIRNLREL